MGGTSTTTQSQQSQTQPWAPAQPLLSGILGQTQGYLPQTGITGTQTGALNTIEQNANNANQFTPAINGVTSNLLNGGGANAQAGNVNQGYQNYYNQTNPLASNTNYNPYSTPGFSDAIGTLTSDITNGVNGQFAAAGRDFSGANQQALTRGLTQGLAPTIAAQYNQNIQNQQGAANNLYGAGNTTAGLLTGLSQQGLANQQAGVGQVSSGLDAANAGSNSTISAEAQRLGIPVQNLGLLASLGVPIAGLGSQSNGTATGSSTMSGAQQFAAIGQGLGGFGKLLFG